MSDKANSSQEVRWPEPGHFRRSIRLEFSLYVSALIVVLMLVTGVIITGQYVGSITRNVVEKLLVQARSYSGSAGKLIISSETPDALLLNNICTKLANDNPDIFWAGIAGQDGTWLAHTEIKEVIAGRQRESFASDEFRDILNAGEAFELQNDTVRITVPVVGNNLAVGNLEVASSAKRISEARTRSLITVASITVAMIVIGLPLTMLMIHRKLRPVTQITGSLKNADLENMSIDITLRSKNEFGYLAETLRVMGARLNLARQQLIERERITRELEIAQEIQANILPREYPQSERFEFSSAYRSAREVGGDYYDFLELDDDHLGFLVADVSGKSLPGMLVMLLTRDIVKRHAQRIRQPADLLCKVNAELISNIKKGMFVTMFVGILDTRSGEFTFASAGHNPLIKISVSSGSATMIKSKGFPLGLVGPDQFDQRIEQPRLKLHDNEWLIQYTDGINEARDSNGEEFGMERFIDRLVSCRDRSATRLVEEVVADHTRFVGTGPQFDDITLVAMKWKGTGIDTSTETTYEVPHAGQS